LSHSFEHVLTDEFLVNEISKFSERILIPNRPKDTETVLFDWNDGSHSQSCIELARSSQKEKEIPLFIRIWVDAFQLYNNSNYKVTNVQATLLSLPTNHRLRTTNLVTVAAVGTPTSRAATIKDRQEKKDLNEAIQHELAALVREMEDAVLQYNTPQGLLTFKLFVHSFSGDMPGIAEVFGTHFPASRQACFLCHQSGSSNPHLQKIVFGQSFQFLPSNHEKREKFLFYSRLGWSSRLSVLQERAGEDLLSLAHPLTHSLTLSLTHSKPSPFSHTLETEKTTHKEIMAHADLAETLSFEQCKNIKIRNPSAMIKCRSVVSNLKA
jgi:hypothetical protein